MIKKKYNKLEERQNLQNTLSLGEISLN